MSNSTVTKHGDLLDTQLNAENNHNKNSGEVITSKLLEREQEEGTPFTLVRSEEGYTILLGLYAITPTFKTKRQLAQFRKKNTWNIIVNVLHAMLDFHKLINQKEINAREEAKENKPE